MIGETVYIHDSNYRQYVDDDGNPSRYANRRLQWRPVVITGETSQSWLFTYMGSEGKINKKTHEVGGRVRNNAGVSVKAYMSESAMLGAVYVSDNAHEIAAAVRDCQDASKLRQIAAILAGE